MAIRRAVTALLLLLLLHAGLAAHAQNTTPVPSQPPRLIIEGKEIILHTVEKGETLYAISKKYSVSQTDIARFNPDIYYGVKKGQILRIPVPQKLTVVDGQTGNEFQLHVVLPGETLYQLARRFSVSVQSIREANLLQSDTLRLYETVRIPTTKDGADGFRPVMHTVQKGETLYSIARLYNVSIESIIHLNPNIQQNGLLEGEQLRIERTVTRPTYSIVDNLAADTITPEQNQTLCNMATPFPQNDTIEIAMLLPFSLGSRIRSADDELDAPATQLPHINADTRFLEFYQGALLALELFQIKGKHARIKVFDTQRNTNRMRQIVASDSLSNTHLIIGPVYPDNISIASEYAAQRRITMVSPLSGKTPSFDANPFLFQANPSLLTQLRLVVQTLPYDSVARIILLREEGENEKDLSESVLSMLQENIAKREISPSLVQTVTFARGNPAIQSRTALLKHLLPDQRNLILLPSNNEAFVGEILGLLKAIALTPAYRIEVYGMPKWLRLPKLDIEELISLQTTLFTPFHVDYTQPAVLDFVDTYRATFRSEPSQYAFQGFDILRYFVSAIHSYGEDFRYCLNRLDVPLLQTPFHFEQSKQFGSYESVGLYLLRFTPENGLTATPLRYP